MDKGIWSLKFSTNVSKLKIIISFYLFLSLLSKKSHNNLTKDFLSLEKFLNFYYLCNNFEIFNKYNFRK